MSKKLTLGLVDTIIVLLASCSLLLFLFWAAAIIVDRPIFNNLPAWVTDISSAIYTTFTTILFSFIVWIVRRQVLGKSETPPYVIWILAITVLLGVMVTVISIGLSKTKTQVNIENKSTLTMNVMSTDQDPIDGVVQIAFNRQPTELKQFYQGIATWHDLDTSKTSGGLEFWIRAKGYKTTHFDTIFQQSFSVVMEAVDTPTKRLEFSINVYNEVLVRKIEQLTSSTYSEQSKNRIIISYSGNIEKVNDSESLYWYQGGHLVVSIANRPCEELYSLRLPNTLVVGNPLTAVQEQVNTELQKLVSANSSLLCSSIAKCIKH